MACTNNPQPNVADIPEPAKEEQQQTAFSNWLKSYSLTSAYFKDTIAEKADSLWAYAFPLERTDSLYQWYPSTDSSYYLLTNIDKASQQSIFKKNDDIEYRFLNTRNKTVFIGITLLHDGPLSPVDIFWYDPETVYLLEKDKINSDYELVRLRIQVDTIWSYRTRKIVVDPNVKPPSGQQ